eukprot:GHVN01084456.1.p1 GENE.GHVN01084456.1~~GHVN01084456.1.p1  ORF type:complete len:155 (+),score=20.32 GHVN01084456.1:338-802(+)
MSDKEEQRAKPGDFVVYLRSDHERATLDESPYSFKYSPKWSLPANVQSAGNGVLHVVEYGTGVERKVPLSQVKLLPKDLPPAILKVNWEHIKHCLPTRGIFPITAIKLPDAYYELKPTQEHDTGRKSSIEREGLEPRDPAGCLVPDQSQEDFDL